MRKVLILLQITDGILFNKKGFPFNAKPFYLSKKEYYCTNSTLRFNFLPSSVELSAIG